MGGLGGLFTSPEVLARLTTNPQVRCRGRLLPLAGAAAAAGCRHLGLQRALPLARCPHWVSTVCLLSPLSLQTRALLAQPDFMAMLQDINRNPGAPRLLCVAPAVHCCALLRPPQCSARAVTAQALTPAAPCRRPLCLPPAVTLPQHVQMQCKSTWLTIASSWRCKWGWA